MEKNQKITRVIKQVINEVTKVNFAGHGFALKVGVNEDPQKTGIKIQFIPTEFGQMTSTQQNDIAIELETRLEKGLSKYKMKVERDRNLKSKSTIGFFIYIEYIDRIIRSILTDKETLRILAKSSNPETGAEEKTKEV